MIAPNGGLQMVYGSARVFGTFDGPTFHGQITLPGPPQRPGCTYVMNLRRRPKSIESREARHAGAFVREIPA
jgi:hypothetical protein